MIAGHTARQTVFVAYGREIEEEIARLSSEIEKVPALKDVYHPRWLAIKLIEGEEDLLAEVENAAGTESLRAALAESMTRLRRLYGEDLDVAIADYRYGFVRGLVKQVLTRTMEQRLTTSDKIDRVVTHKWLGIPLFLALMYLVFNLVQNVSAPYLDWVDAVISGPVTSWTGALLVAVGAPDWVLSLFTDGIIAGVGGVLVFVPGLLVMYFSLAFLEDTGYLA